MRNRVLIALLGVLVFAALSSQAEAGGRSGHHGHGGHSYHGGHSFHHGGHSSYHGGHYLFWLAPFAWGRHWYPTYPYHQETTVIAEERTVYVERPRSAEPAESWWYYCESAGGYYPDVARCPERWVKVAPRPESR